LPAFGPAFFGAPLEARSLVRDQDSLTASNLGAFASSWLAALRFTSDAKAPTPDGPAISTKDVGRIFFSGSKAQRKRAMPEKNDAVRGLRAPWIKSRLGTAPTVSIGL